MTKKRGAIQERPAGLPLAHQMGEGSRGEGIGDSPGAIPVFAIAFPFAILAPMPTLEKTPRNRVSLHKTATCWKSPAASP